MPKFIPETIRLPIQPPLNGVNRSFARGNQPAGTCWDALNMLPRDRQFRHRVSTRPGLGIQDDLETDAPVRLLHTASFATGADSGASTALASFSQTFSAGANAQLSASWVVREQGATAVYESLDQTRLVQRTGPPLLLEMTGTDPDGDHTGAFYASSLAATLPTHYKLTAVVRLDPGESRSNYILWRMGGLGTAGVTGLIAYIEGGLGGDPNVVFASVDLDGFNGLDTVSVPLSLGSNHTLAVDVNGNSITISVDGVTKITATSSLFASQTGFGLALDEAISSYGFVSYAYDNLDTGVANISRTNLKLVACSGEDTFIGTPSTMAAVSNSSTYPIDDTSFFVSAATLFGFTYIVDGANIYKLNLDSEDFEAYSASAGSAPTGCTIAVAWRGRLVLSGADADPQNIFASRVSDPTDWDYGQEDPAAAWAANTAPSGRVGQPVLALIPISDDLLIVGCEQSIWCVRGDPADGGSIDLVTDVAGISGPNAWCRVNDGSTYFVGPGGFFKLNADGSFGGRVDDTSYPQYFVQFDRFTTHATLVFDIERNAVWIYAAPEDVDSAPAISLYYDMELKGFWPIEFTNLPDAGPLSAVLWDGFGSDSRYIVLGGYTGQLYWQSRNRTADNTTEAIESYVIMGPYSLSSVDDATAVRLDLTSGEVASNGESDSFWNIDWTVQGGRTAYSVTEGTPANTATGTYSTQGHELTEYPRTRGGWFTLKLANTALNKYFVVENALLHVLPSGMQR